MHFALVPIVIMYAQENKVNFIICTFGCSLLDVWQGVEET